jgi:hypothetical protein
MKWGKLLGKLVAALLTQPRAQPAERHSMIPGVPPMAGRLPVVTRDMIEPRDKVLDRYDIAEAYRDFFSAHFEPWNEYELRDAYDEVIYSYTGHIEAMERDRGELMPRLKEARYALHEVRRELAKAEGEDRADYEAWVAEAEATLARRLARVEAADACIVALKADARDFFVWFLNEKIQEHNERLR